MPLKKSPNGGGTNTNGTISKIYCANCYENGQFINPDWTANQMQGFVKKKMKDMGFIMSFFANLLHLIEEMKYPIRNLPKK